MKVTASLGSRLWNSARQYLPGFRTKEERLPFTMDEFRNALEDVMIQRRGGATVKGRLDAAQTTNENKKHWAQTDSLSARAAYSPFDRQHLRDRSRYESENNSYYSGLLDTAVAHIIGRGPRLQVLSQVTDANARLEKAWKKWVLDNGFIEDIRVAVMTYWRDGECFLLRRYRRNTPFGKVGLKVKTYEAEQVSNPYAAPQDPYVEDGIRIDDLGDPVEYYFLDQHPGDINVPSANRNAGKWYPAADVIHLFRRRRPGQLRGVPRITPSLELFPKMRRHTLATLAAAEAVANWTLFIKTNSSAIAPKKMPTDFVSMEFARSMLNFLPDGWEPHQIKPEQPTTNHAMFQMATLMEICRCAGVPYLLAAGTSKDSNYSSAQMDVRNIWAPEVIADQDRITQILLEKVWAWFLEDAVMVPELLDGFEAIDDIEHQWLFDPLPTTDLKDEADAGAIMLDSGQAMPSELYARRGKDFDTEIRRGAVDYGIPEPVLRQAFFLNRFPNAAGVAQPNGVVGADGQPVGPTAGTSGSGPLAALGRRQLQNNVKATNDILQSFINGKQSETQTRLLLQGVGWSSEAAEEFMQDVRDGKIDDPRALAENKGETDRASINRELAV